MGSIMFINKSAEIKGQQKTVAPSTSQQVILPDAGYNALTSVTVNAVDNTIDSNIQASNIKKGVSILGVTGTLEAALQIAPTNTFTDATAKQFYDIQTAYDNMQPRVLTDTDKTIDENIYCIPTKSDGTPLLDTSNVTIGAGLFYNCVNLKYIPLLNFSKMTNAVGIFQSCKNLIKIAPINTSNLKTMNNFFTGCKALKSIPELDTHAVTNMVNMFLGCGSLVSVPILDMSSLTDIQNMFNLCLSLSTNSLNNILASLATATKITSNKTLAYIGLSEEQATTCKTLSNWAACEAAGWTTGY